jgi:hypothetical protein
MPLQFSDVTRPSSGGSVQMLFGAITHVVCVLSTHPTQVITPNSISAEPSEDGRETSETCRGIDS